MLLIFGYAPLFSLAFLPIAWSPTSPSNTALGISDESESIINRSTSPVCIISTAMLNPSSPDDG